MSETKHKGSSIRSMTQKYPPPIYSNLPGTWAYSTVSKRLPEIAARVIAENDYPASLNENLSWLQDEIKSHPIRPLPDQNAPDQENWEQYIRPYLGQNWLDVPWFFAEHYFYRRIMAAVNYFQLGQDPFAYQKSAGLKKSKVEIQLLSDFLAERIGKQGINSLETLREGLYFSLWGNQADLSLWPADGDSSPQYTSRETLQDHLLASQMEQLLEFVSGEGQPLPRVDLMLDNAGFELISDLALVDIFLSHGFAERVVLQAKAHPTFVSDVIPADIVGGIRFLIDQPEPAINAFGQRLENHINSGKLRTTSHFFWNSPLPMWELSDDLRKEWKGTSLVISKGDANYRRLLGDRQWKMTLPFQDVMDFLPVPLAALRTLKAELAVGLDMAKIEEVKSQDPDWMVNGRWGVIHFTGGREAGGS